MTLNDGMLQRSSNPMTLFDDLFKRSIPSITDTSTGSIPLDVYEDEGNWVIEASVPGYDEDDVEVELNDNILTLHADKEESFEAEDEDRNWYRKEITRSSTTRKVRLPQSASYTPEEVNAVMKNGILEISIPKQEQTNNDVKTIDIEAG